LTWQALSKRRFGFGKLGDLGIDHDDFIQSSCLVARLVAHHETLVDTNLGGCQPNAFWGTHEEKNFLGHFADETAV
jgi:hypothetical protein